MNNFIVFQDIWNAIAVPILAASAPIIGALQGWITGPFQLCVLAYLVSMLLIAAWSDDDEVALKFFRNLFLAVVIYTLAATASGFGTYVTGLVNGLVSGISGTIAGVLGGEATNASSFDTTATKLFAVGLVVFRDLPWYSPKGWTLAVLVVIYWMVSFFAIAAMFAVFMLSSVILQFLIAFGPLFIACFFFPFTRQFFDGWLRTVVAALITQIFIIGLMTLFITGIGTMITILAAGINAGSDGFISSIYVLVVTLVMCGIFVFLAFHVSRLAQSIAGGAHAQFAEIPRFGDKRGNTDGNLGSNSGGGNARRPGGGGTPEGSSTTSQPPRQYAFQRSAGGTL